MSAPVWTTLRIRSISDRQAVIKTLFDLGAEGVQELDTEVVTCLRGVDSVRTAARLRATDPDATCSFEPTPDTDWSKAWRSHLTARRVERFVVTPPWLEADYAPEERIVIDPGMAFGTGDHETTRGVLQLLQSVVRPGDLVADLGTGSGVLAIAAAKMGARHAYGIESDPDAIDNANANVTHNGVSDRVTILEGDAAVFLPLVAPVRIIAANIVATVLTSLLPTMAASLSASGHAVLGGVLVDEAPHMRDVLTTAGWRVAETIEEGAWWSATILRA